MLVIRQAVSSCQQTDRQTERPTDRDQKARQADRVYSKVYKDWSSYEAQGWGVIGGPMGEGRKQCCSPG